MSQTKDQSIVVLKKLTADFEKSIFWESKAEHSLKFPTNTLNYLFLQISLFFVV